MVYSDTHKFVFLPIPRTGTTTIVKLLLSNYDGIIWPPEKSSHKGWHETKNTDRFKDYLSFTFVRNPIQRANSLRLFLLNHDVSPNPPCFNENLNIFLKRMLKTDHWFFKNQSHWVSLFKPKIICKTEEIEGHFNSLPFVNKTHKLGRLNKSVLDNEISLTKELTELSKEWAYSDYVNFGYSPKSHKVNWIN